MALYKDKNFTKKTMKLDSNQYQNCQFIDCEMRYSGGLPPNLTGCNFQDCTWSFGGEAAYTLGFLSGLYNGGFDELVESTFHLVRKGHFLNVPKQNTEETGTDSSSKPETLLQRFPKILKIPLRDMKRK